MMLNGRTRRKPGGVLAPKCCSPAAGARLEARSEGQVVIARLCGRVDSNPGVAGRRSEAWHDRGEWPELAQRFGRHGLHHPSSFGFGCSRLTGEKVPNSTMPHSLQLTGGCMPWGSVRLIHGNVEEAEGRGCPGKFGQPLRFEQSGRREKYTNRKKTDAGDALPEMDSSLQLPDLIQDALCHQAARDHGRGQARPRMGAGAHEVQVAVAGMAVGRSQVGQLGQVM